MKFSGILASVKERNRRLTSKDGVNSRKSQKGITPLFGAMPFLGLSKTVKIYSLLLHHNKKKTFQGFILKRFFEFLF